MIKQPWQFALGIAFLAFVGPLFANSVMSMRGRDPRMIVWYIALLLAGVVAIRVIAFSIESPSKSDGQDSND